MSKKLNGSLVHQCETNLKDKLAIGQSKFADKINNNTADKIYSWCTFKAYLDKTCKFAKWAKEKYQVKTLEQARPYVDEYLESRGNLSAYTVKLDASALAKLYGCSTEDFIKTKARSRADITRSRKDPASSKHFSEKNHQELVDFCKNTGLRRSELTYLKGNQLVSKDGSYFLRIVGKGGKERTSPILNNNIAVVNKMISAGNNRVWDKIPQVMDVHKYRSDYATSMYKSFARDITNLSKKELYFCRKDLKGVWYDKKAMLKTSKALGHNRISVIAGHYLRGL